MKCHSESDTCQKLTFLHLGKFCRRVLLLPPSVCLSVCLSVCPGRACLRDNSTRIQPRISKFELNVYLGTLSDAIENGVDWPWPSRSFWTLIDQFLQNRACPHNNSTRIRARISKFALNVYLGTLSDAIANGADWPWPSRSFWTLTDQFLQNRACPHNNSTRIRARISKFALNVYLGTLSDAIENWVDWPWPSRSFWT